MEKPTVFISYSHRDEDWKDRLRPHLAALELLDELVVWDDRKIDGGERWYPEIQAAMERASVAVCLISAHYLASPFCVKDEVPFLLQRGDLLFLPVLVKPCLWAKYHWLSATQMLPRDGQTVAVDFEGKEDVVFTEVAARISTYLDEHALAPLTTPSWPPLPAGAVDTARLPETGSALFGRLDELQMLDASWQDKETRLVSLVAHGGVGKSTLVNKWLALMAEDHYRGARRVFGWTFHSQGTGERVTSADYFIREALAFFGDPAPDDGSPWQKGERLARLVGEQRALLVLDGLEPLQSGQPFDRGQIKDPALRTLLRRLARSSQGLCLISTRVPVTDLAGRAAFREVDLERISPEAGRALLRTGGVVATDAELESLSQRFGPHALALNLLGAYVREHHARHGTAWQQAVETIPDRAEHSEAEGRHAWNVLAAFEQLLGDGPEVELLRVLGLFDRPAKAKELAALRRPPAIEGLTEHLVALDEEQWAPLVDRLRGLRLVSAPSLHAPDAVDTHPLVREYYGRLLKEEHPETWRAGHRVLFNHLRLDAVNMPSTMEQMAPLYAAVAHGCKAGRHQDALDEVFWSRIRRGEDQFSAHQLGAQGTDLSALSGFFEQLWTQPVPTLKEADQSFLLNDAGSCLRAVGLLRESKEPTQIALESALHTLEQHAATDDPSASALHQAVRQKYWANASVAAGNLSELALALGDLEEAEQYANQAVELADRSENEFQRITKRSRLATILHQMGRLDASEALFQEAEALQEQRQPNLPFLYSVQGFQYCDLLLGPVATALWPGPPAAEEQTLLATCRHVLERAEKFEQWRVPADSLLTVALEHLTLGRATMMLRQLGALETLDEAKRSLDDAVDGLRHAANQIYVPFGLLARAALRRVQKRYEAAWEDVDEVLEMAETSGMRLFETDALLESARLHCEQKHFAEARACLTQAQALIAETGYHRRDREAEILDGVLADAEA